MSLQTVKEVAERLRTSEANVLRWIAHGELRAINISGTAKSKRPRWVISENDLVDFLGRRANRQPTPTRKPRPTREAIPNYLGGGAA